MGTVKVNDTNGSVSLTTSAPTANYTVTLPNANVAMPMMRLSTAQASTSGTAIDFTDVPSWAKKITVMFNGVSTNGTSIPIIQLGTSGGIDTSGYIARSTGLGSTTLQTVDFTTGFGIRNDWGGTRTAYGSITITAFGGNTFQVFGGLGMETLVAGLSFGAKTLSGTLDRIRITTVNGTDTFDAGSINVLYEGY